MDFIKHPDAQFADIRSLDRAAAEREVADLRHAIEYHNYRYYVESWPVVSDAAYDRLFRRLQALEEAFPDLRSPVSPTVRVGAAPVSRLKKARHAAPMLSLNAALDEKEFRAFDRTVRNAVPEPVYICEPKYDGLSIEVVYRDGLFERAVTRGDGETGEDVSENVKTVPSVPLRLRDPETAPAFLSVRGEVYLRREGFTALNRHRIERGEEPFANPRNAASGLIRQLDPKNVAGKPFDIVFYDLLRAEGVAFGAHRELLDLLRGWGLKTGVENRACRTPEEVVRYRDDMAARRDGLAYELDGVVVKLDDYAGRERLGFRERSPRWAFAWKFPPKEEVTRLADIAVQVGKTGILTPVALLDPVDIGGVTVSRATLHNEDEVRRKDVRPGDRVRVERAGDVIPEVVERLPDPDHDKRNPFVMPGRCPSCGAPVYREGAYVICPQGLACPAQLIGRIAHYAARGAMDIAGLGGRTVQQLVDRGLVRTVADLYTLPVEDFRGLEGFADKSARQLHAAIHAAARPRLDRFLFALGIPDAGEHVARVLAERFRTLDAVMDASQEELERVPGVGRAVALSVRKFFEDEANRTAIRRIRQAGVAVQPAAPPRGGARPLAGKTLVFTGELEHFTRRKAQDLAESLGGRAASSVSNATDLVVAGTRPGAKLDEAKKHNVKVIDEKEFEKLAGRK